VRIALDATYSVDPHPSGIAVYSRELLSGLARVHPDDEFLHCYRPKQYLSATSDRFPNVQKRLLIPPVPTFRASIYHGLNQRVDVRPARLVVCTFHDLFVMTSEYSSLEFRRRFAGQARRAAANSDLIITVSEFTATQVQQLLNIRRSKIRVISHGCRPAPAVVGTEREQNILFVGALQVRKNVVRLVEAFEQLPADWTLTLAGATAGFGASKIMQRIEASGARPRIEVTGYVSTEALERLYGKASIFAFPSLGEGFGMPVLDAMSRGLPVVTSRISALPEVAGDAALLVDPSNTDEIAAALRNLADDSGLRDTLVHRGKARAAMLTWDAAVEKTYAVYRELIS
jgi:glycosyltransferase involved in cell wall biosynthesis